VRSHFASVSPPYTRHAVLSQPLEFPSSCVFIATAEAADVTHDQLRSVCIVTKLHIHVVTRKRHILCKCTTS
jgi:hypothetical protein